MPYNIKKRKCKQSGGDSGEYVLSYTDKKGKNRKACHTSKKKANSQIAAIEMPRESNLKNKNKRNELKKITLKLLRKIIKEEIFKKINLN